ncbi:hypothetical protein PENTCL1PPCAC_15682, partial [Pristionchus entomophagus]
AKSLANPFRILTLNQAVTDLINSSVFAFIIAPTVFFSLPLPIEVTARLGRLLFLAYDCCSWSHLLITLNRFTFTFFPFTYTEVFSRSKTLIYLVSHQISSVRHPLFSQCSVECNFYLPIGAWNFDFKGGDDCKKVEWYLNYCRNMVLTACIAIIDIVTLIKFHLYSTFDKNSFNKKIQHRQEFFFLIQALCQSLLFYSELICCYNIG